MPRVVSSMISVTHVVNKCHQVKNNTSHQLFLGLAMCHRYCLSSLEFDYSLFYNSRIESIGFFSDAISSPTLECKKSAGLSWHSTDKAIYFFSSNFPFRSSLETIEHWQSLPVTQGKPLVSICLKSPFAFVGTAVFDLSIHHACTCMFSTLHIV